MEPEQKRKQGRPRKTIEPSELATLRRLVEADPSMSLRAIAEAMATQTGKRLSLMAWSRALKAQGFSKVVAKKTIITEEKPAASNTTHYRAVHRRESEPGRYPSSLTDLEWEALQPVLERKGGAGCPASHDRRVMWDAVFYQVRSGASWRMLPADFPSYKAVFAFFARARDSGLLEKAYERLHNALERTVTAEPTAERRIC